VSSPTSIGRYTIVGELGRGAMGVVFRAVDPALDRPVAIKVIAARSGSVPLSVEELEARFLREARVAARISHPGVVTVHDAGREGESLYLVMELVDGESLSERLARRRFPSAPEALEIVAQVADALGAAHSLGVVHRDIKPSNIMMTRGGRVKVADFGVAKAMGEQTDLTRTGTVIGSPAYMAPEQVRGEVLDGRADLFSLGVVLYELLLRRKPFPADTVTTLIYQILHDDPLADPQISRALGGDAAAFLGRCLAKTVDARVPDAAAFAAEARALAARLPVSSVEITGPTMKIPVVSPAALPAVEGSAPAHTSSAEKVRGLPVVPLVILGAGVLALVLAFLFLRGNPPAGEVLPAPETPTPAPAVAAQVPTVPAAIEEQKATPTARPSVRPTVAATPSEDVTPPLAEVSQPRPTATPPIGKTYECREGAIFGVDPEEALITVNGATIGTADEWDDAGGGQKYVFGRPGTYYVKMSLEKYRTAWVKIVVRPEAKEDFAEVDLDLEELKD